MDSLCPEKMMTAEENVNVYMRQEKK